MKLKAYIFLVLALPLGSWITVPNFNTLTYDIRISNNKIGELRAIKTETGSWTTYSIQTNLAFRVFESYDINYQLSTSYKGSLMMETSMKNMVNGKLENNVRMKWDGTNYVGYNNGNQISIHEKIHYSVARLYFHEPHAVVKVFSEKYGLFQPLKFNNKSEYTLLLEDGNKSKYTYLNGICTEVTTSKGLFKIIVKLRSIS